MDNACVRMVAGRVGGARTAESASKHGKCAVVADDLISALILLPSLYCSSCHQTGRNRHTCEGGSGKDARAGNAAHAEPASQQAFPRPDGHCSPWPVT